MKRGILQVVLPRSRGFSIWLPRVLLVPFFLLTLEQEKSLCVCLRLPHVLQGRWDPARIGNVEGPSRGLHRSHRLQFAGFLLQISLRTERSRLCPLVLAWSKYQARCGTRSAVQIPGHPGPEERRQAAEDCLLRESSRMFQAARQFPPRWTRAPNLSDLTTLVHRAKSGREIQDQRAIVSAKAYTARCLPNIASAQLRLCPADCDPPVE